MVIISACSFGLSAVLLILSFVTSKSTSRKLKNASFLVAIELSYSLVVFSTANMVTALCIESQEGMLLNTELMWSKGMLVGSMVMIAFTHLLYLSTAEDTPDVGTFFRKHTKLGVYCPIIFNVRLLAITTLLFTFHTTENLPGYFIIIIQVGYVLFVIFGRPHKKGFDVFRASCLEIGLLYVFVARFA